MLARLYSFKFIIGAALLWLGVLAYGLAIYSTYVYRDHTIETQLKTLETRLERETEDAIQDLYDKIRVFALGLQSETMFKQALVNRDRAAMEDWLGQSYSRNQASSGQFSRLRWGCPHRWWQRSWRRSRRQGYSLRITPRSRPRCAGRRGTGSLLPPKRVTRLIRSR